jgi:hypothetical protein
MKEKWKIKRWKERRRRRRRRRSLQLGRRCDNKMNKNSSVGGRGFFLVFIFSKTKKTTL